MRLIGKNKASNKNVDSSSEFKIETKQPSLTEINPQKEETEVKTEQK